MRARLRSPADHRAREEAIGRPQRSLRLTEAAEADLAEIWTTIAAEASEPVAMRFVAALRSTFERLLAFPFSEPSRDQLACGLRVAFHRPYAIYYTLRGDELMVIRVLHGARDAAALARSGAFAGPDQDERKLPEDGAP